MAEQMEAISLYHHLVADPRIDRIERKVDYLIRAVLKLTGEEQMSRQEFDAAMKRINDEVTRSTTVQEGVRTLVGKLADEIRANANDPTALNAMADRLAASDNATADAVTANTPADPGTGGTTGGTTGGDTGGTTGGDTGGGVGGIPPA